MWRFLRAYERVPESQRLLPEKRGRIMFGCKQRKAYYWLICHTPETYIKSLMKDLCNGTHFNFTHTETCAALPPDWRRTTSPVYLSSIILWGRGFYKALREQQTILWNESTVTALWNSVARLGINHIFSFFFFCPFNLLRLASWLLCAQQACSHVFPSRCERERDENMKQHDIFL